MPGWTIIPHITTADAAGEIDFLTRAFNARELRRLTTPDGDRIMHAELLVNGAHLYVSDHFCEGAAPEPQGVVLHVELREPDQAFARALEAGAQALMPMEDTFWGARYGRVKSPGGITWSLSRQLRQVSDAELREAAEKMFTPP